MGSNPIGVRTLFFFSEWDHFLSKTISPNSKEFVQRLTFHISSLLRPSQYLLVRLRKPSLDAKRIVKSNLKRVEGWNLLSLVLNWRHILLYTCERQGSNHISKLAVGQDDMFNTVVVFLSPGKKSNDQNQDVERDHSHETCHKYSHCRSSSFLFDKHKPKMKHNISKSYRSEWNILEGFMYSTSAYRNLNHYIWLTVLSAQTLLVTS